MIIIREMLSGVNTMASMIEQYFKAAENSRDKLILVAGKLTTRHFVHSTNAIIWTWMLNTTVLIKFTELWS